MSDTPDVPAEAEEQANEQQKKPSFKEVMNDIKKEESANEVSAYQSDEVAPQDTEKVTTDDVVEAAEEAAEAQEEAEDEEDVELDDLDEPKQELQPREKFIYDNLPSIQVRGTVDGKEKTLTIKLPSELPDDFEFASRREELNYLQAVTSQELNARTLDQQYKNQQAQEAQARFDQLEAQDIANDVEFLQKQGILPEFKYKPNNPKFNDDPAVKEANEIHALYEKLNNEYFNRYKDSGRMYRVSYKDAAYQYYANKPKPLEEKPKTPVKSTEQLQREKVASRVSAPQGADTHTRSRTLPPGTSIDRVYQMYKQGRI